MIFTVNLNIWFQHAYWCTEMSCRPCLCCATCLSKWWPISCGSSASLGCPPFSPSILTAQYHLWRQTTLAVIPTICHICHHWKLQIYIGTKESQSQPNAFPPQALWDNFCVSQHVRWDLHASEHSGLVKCIDRLLVWHRNFRRKVVLVKVTRGDPSCNKSTLRPRDSPECKSMSLLKYAWYLWFVYIILPNKRNTLVYF